MPANKNDSDGSDYDVDDFFGHRAPVASRAPPMAKAAPVPKDGPAQSRSNHDSESDEGEDDDDGDDEPSAAAKPSAPARAPAPVITDTRTFAELGVHPTLIHHLANRMNITDPTPIQRAVYSTLLTNPKLSHRDVAIQSETGSGKTLSFLLPIIQSLLFPDPEPTEQPSARSAPCACGAATGEEEEEGDAKSDKVEKLFVPATGCVGHHCAHPQGHQRHCLDAGPFLGSLAHNTQLGRYAHSLDCLDEADRLLDLGFERDLKAIWAYLHGMPDPGRTMDGSQPQNQQKPEPRKLPIPPTFAWPNRRQVFLCSATIHKVASLAAWVLDKPVHVSAKGLHKLLALVTYLADMARGMHHSDVPRKLIVFFSTRGAVDYFHTLLARFFSKDRTDPVLGFQAGLDITKLHGSMDANERKAAIAGFADAANAAKPGTKRGSLSKGGKGQVLITTDVAARGLDLHGVDLIIQYDAPTDVAEYVHRAGRTARAGRKGAAVLILTPHEEEFATKMIAEKVGTMESVDIAAKIGKLLRCPDNDAWEKAAVKQWQIPFEDWVAKDKSVNTLAMLGFQAHVKGYATYPSALKPIFHVRKLHLGHLAKSFCLRNAPTELHQVLGQNQQQAANAKKKREAEAADGEGGEPAKKKKKVFADGVESYAKTAQANMNRQFASEFQTSTSAYLGGKKKRK
ncbi:P-loop containing nucleoside triphosphate hydrolase protein [Catenaria anguillulae PL171]|uniref:ATP-dependent RNA helicase n=1 Tax=Catenaria anguillulae PL171 TaxID=765915 RepID=A0A1Y2HN34_9FUNG|nr:P-loop containing nucleoside triphosphate hydrolase protein [Catenaria anguillulae PL171]